MGSPFDKTTDRRGDIAAELVNAHVQVTRWRGRLVAAGLGLREFILGSLQHLAECENDLGTVTVEGPVPELSVRVLDAKVPLTRASFAGCSCYPLAAIGLAVDEDLHFRGA